MHKAQKTGRIFWIGASILLLGAVIAGMILYWQRKGRVHDTSGMILVDMAAKLLTRGH